jgi:FixJ family two-component response regulator
MKSWVGIVDDDVSIRIALARALRGNGIRVETFASAEEYLHRSVQGEPECVVLDIDLGEVSGFDLYDRLVSEGTAPPTVFITGRDDMFRRRPASTCACGFLRKPFDTRALMALLRPHLRSSYSPK